MKAKRVILPLLAVFLVCLYPCAFHYLQNAGEAHAADMLPMLGLLLGTAAVLLALTNAVKQTKKLHPIVFIIGSALVGVVLRLTQ